MNDNAAAPPPTLAKPVPNRTLEPGEIRRCLRQLLRDNDGTVRHDSVLCNGLTAGEFCVMYLQKSEMSRKAHQERRVATNGEANLSLASHDVSAAERCRRDTNRATARKRRR